MLCEYIMCTIEFHNKQDITYILYRVHKKGTWKKNITFVG